MSNGFRRSDGLMVFTNYDPTNPHLQKNLVIDTEGREMVVVVPREGSISADGVKKLSDGLPLDDGFPLHKLFQLEDKKS